MFRRWKGPPFAPRKSSQAKKTGRKKIKKGEGNSPPLFHSSLLRAAAPPDDIFFFSSFCRILSPLPRPSMQSALAPARGATAASRPLRTRQQQRQQKRAVVVARANVRVLASSVDRCLEEITKRI